MKSQESFGISDRSLEPILHHSGSAVLPNPLLTDETDECGTMTSLRPGLALGHTYTLRCGAGVFPSEPCQPRLAPHASHACCPKTDSIVSHVVGSLGLVVWLSFCRLGFSPTAATTTSSSATAVAVSGPRLIELNGRSILEQICTRFKQM